MKYPHKQVHGVIACATLFALSGCATGGVPADVTPAVAPSLAAHAVYERLVEATGGRAALERYSSAHAVGTLSVPAQGVEGDLEVFSAAPNRFLLHVSIPGFGAVRSGYDGTVGWSINPAMGPMVLDGNQLAQMRQQADFFGPLNMEAYVDSAEVVGEEQFEGKLCQKIRVVTKWGEEYVEFYDVATGLAVGNIRSQETPMGAVEATTVFSDYTDFGGILTPSRMVQSVMGMEQIFTITAIDYDAVDPAVFALPDEIKALVK